MTLLSPSAIGNGFRREGAALVIVLAFVVLLTGLVVAYFARSIAARQLSNSSAGQTKSALLARSASDFIIAGLKQEIANGSSPTPTPGVTPYFIPTAPVNAVPVRFGTPMPISSPVANTEAIPNLVRISVAGDLSLTGDYPSMPTPTIPPPAVPSYASAVSSSTAAINGHVISPARWNSHYLIPRVSPTPDSDSNPDPSLNFHSPDWVLVSRAGPAVEITKGGSTSGGIGIPQAAFTNAATAINNPVSTNQNYVVGRYAYAIYDEGGLLDMNVAGHPTAAMTASPTSATVPAPTPPTSLPFTPTQISQKGSLAMADLTQLPIVNTPAVPHAASDYFAQSTIDMIVGWRNYGAAGPTGNFPVFTFTGTQSANWFGNFAFRNITGFRQVYGGSTTSSTSGGATDQAFLSRQQLLQLRNSINAKYLEDNPGGTNLPFPASVLQYMGTFGRSLEQPSYVPAHIRYPTSSGTGIQEAPSINAVATSTPPPAGVTTSPDVDDYKGNNDQAGTRASVNMSYQDDDNPSFLTARVLTGFTRYDLPKTPAIAGEPLVKKKFPLSRLAEIRYDATDSTTSLTDPNFTSNSSSTNPGTKNHILDWFGLSRSNASSAWTYNHGNTFIMSLSDVARANREPDFAELLKAAINVGALGKGGPPLHTNQGNYQYTLDTAVDYQILQIMANIIDQYDTDSYPTVIQIASGSDYRTFRGIEDLPYFYRYHPFSVVTSLPNPLLDASKSVAFTVPDTKTPTRTLAPCEPLENASGGLVDGGHVVGLYVPEIWNPHDYSTLLSEPSPTSTTGNLRPSRYRLTVITDDPALPTPLTPSWQTGMKSQMNQDWYDDIPPKAKIPEALMALTDPGTPTSTLTSFTFGDNNGVLFREPTLLWRANYPTGINLNIAAPADVGSLAGPYTDVNTQIQYFGVQIGQGAISYVGKVDHTVYPTSPQSVTDQFIFQASNANTGWQFPLPANAYAQYTFRLQYQDPNNALNWITYDEKYPDIHSMAAATMVVNTADFPNNEWWNPLASNQLSASNACAYDPRTSRYGIGTSSTFDENVQPQETVAAINYNQNTSPSANLLVGKSNFTIFYTSRAFADIGSKVNYSNPCMTSDPGKNQQMRWFSGVGYSGSNGQDTSPVEYDGLLFAQNDPSIIVPERKSGTLDQHLYYEDADGVARRAMGAYVNNNAFGNNNTFNATTPGIGAYTNLEGMPLAWADRISSGYPTTVGSSGATVQNQSRPLVINRPFRSVAEMSYASRGEPWKQIDFFTPESGDSALLDVFCVNETPPDALVTGKVNLNSHQVPVFQAIAANATRDEVKNMTGAPTYSVGALTPTESNLLATTLVGITTDSTDAWRGPLMNVGDLVGHYVNLNSAPAATDLYTFNETVTGKQYSYSGFSQVAFLSPPAYTLPTTSSSTVLKQSYRIQRMHEAAIRALVDSGQTRVWNLMLDVVAQTGRYSPNSNMLSQFSIDGESRYWIHVAIDRYTGEVIDKQIELVSQ